MHQWHGGTCGYHALWNAQCLLAGDVARLMDEPAFWNFVFNNVDRLIAHGESSAGWPRSRFLGGVADGCHLKYLAATNSALKDCLSVSEIACQFEATPGLARLRAGSMSAEAFLVGAQTHWYCIVVQPAAMSGQPRLWICDSYNASLAILRTSEDVQGLVKSTLELRDQKQVESLKKTAEWCHRPDADIEAAVQDGIPEWWKGAHRSALFWRYKPMELRKHLLTQEYSDISSHIKLLLDAMAKADSKVVGL